MHNSFTGVNKVSNEIFLPFPVNLKGQKRLNWLKNINAGFVKRNSKIILI